MKLNHLLNSGIKDIMKTALRYYMGSREGRAFLTNMLPQLQRSAGLRNSYEKAGTHIPPFLIASIASQCNLHCAGCYARSGGSCGPKMEAGELTAAQWRAVFEEAAELGVSFILLAGGEPFLRRDVMEAAAQVKRIIFPVFTNGTMLDENSLQLLYENRNVVPVLSIEGEALETDARRGMGTYKKVDGAMSRLQDKRILFGASITVTKENLGAVTDEGFISRLRARGCGLVFFVEYVPVSAGTEHLVLDQNDMEALQQSAAKLKKDINDMIILCFPGDEAGMGGCLASGRGFFHINAAGGAEPCPFSPYAKLNLKTAAILDVLKSDYFASLREIAQSADAHAGGCTLFREEKQVRALIAR